MGNPIIVTYSTKNDILINQNLLNWNILIIKENEWKGFKHKFQCIVSLIPKLKDSFSHLISLDAYDTVIVRNQNDWIAPKENLIISAEVNCWPDKRLEKDYPEVKTKYKFVNSHFCLNIQNEINPEFLNIIDKDDQLHLTKYYLKHKPKLDSNCEIFQSLYQINQNDFDENLKNLETNTYPFFFHGNGKVDLSWLISKMHKK